MAMSGKERQRKWQERQKANGKKRVTVMMDQDALAVLEQEKERTGESLSCIVSRAVLKIGNKVSDNETLGAARNKNENVSDNELINKNDIMERISTLIGVVGLSEDEVAERFIDEKIEPLSHGEAWNAETIKTLYIQSISSPG